MHRRASRVLLIDTAGRVLLFRGCDPARPADKFWFSVGGGIEGHETPREAACRELREETGIAADPSDLTGPVHRDVTQFGFDGYVYRQQQEFFVLRVSHCTVDTSGFEAIEMATMDKYHWWSGDELATTTQRCHPDNLVELLDEITCDTH